MMSPDFVDAHFQQTFQIGKRAVIAAVFFFCIKSCACDLNSRNGNTEKSALDTLINIEA